MSTGTGPSEKPTQLGSLVKKHRKHAGLSQRELAERIGRRSASYIGNIESCKGRTSLPRESILRISATLGLDLEETDELLLAADHSPTSREEKVGDLVPRPLSRESRPRLNVIIVTDPRFIDSALFSWLFKAQPLEHLNVICRVKPTHWHGVPATLSYSPYALGFYNRDSLRRAARRGHLPLQAWVDLTFYTGYALIGRASDPDLPDRFTIQTVQNYLQKKADSGKPRIISMGADSVTKLSNSLSPISEENFDFRVYPNVDEALHRFSTENEGDFFVGGLPQRLAVSHQAAFVEVLNYQINPLLCSVNSLVCTTKLIEERPDIPALISSLWFGMIRLLKTNTSYRVRVEKKVVPYVESELGITDHSLSEELLRRLFDSPHQDWEVFPTTPAGVTEEIVRAASRAYSMTNEHSVVDELLKAFGVSPES